MTARIADSADVDAIGVPPAKAAPDAALRAATWRLQVVAGVAATITAAWVAVVLLTVGHGFADSDEGFYLLLYRWWAELPPNFTGVNYIYGPIFDLLGHNIVALRVFRLLTVLATHAAFGWAFMIWLRTRRPNAPATRWWEVSGCLALVASGAMVYSWLPLSAGYNDISTLGGLLAGAIVLAGAAHVERGTKIPAWLPAMLGPLAILIGLAKWSSALATFVVVGVVGVNVVRRAGWRQVGRVALWAFCGLVLTFVLWQLLLAPLASVFVAIAKVNRRIMYISVAPDYLLTGYRDQVIEFGQAAIRVTRVLLIGAVLATLARGRYWRWVALAVVLVGGALAMRTLLVQGAYIGGGFHGTLFTISLMALLMVPLAVGVTAVVRDRVTRFVAKAALTADRATDTARVLKAPGADSSLTRPGGRSWAMLAMLVLLPITQAAGSSTGLLGMAIDSLAAWVAVAIAILTGIEAAPATARWLTRVVTAVVVVMAASIAVTGLWAHPYLTPGRAVTTASVPGVPAMAGIKLDPPTAQLYSDLHQRLLPWIEPPGRAIMAFDQIAGLVLLLDGRPVGEAWTGAADPWRTADSMRAECLGPNRWWGDRAPLLLFNRPVTDIERDTLHICGYDLDTTYRLLAPRDQLDGLEVYVPRAG